MSSAGATRAPAAKPDRRAARVRSRSRAVDATRWTCSRQSAASSTSSASAGRASARRRRRRRRPRSARRAPAPTARRPPARRPPRRAPSPARAAPAGAKTPRRGSGEDEDRHAADRRARGHGDLRAEDPRGAGAQRPGVRRPSSIYHRLAGGKPCVLGREPGQAGLPRSRRGRTASRRRACRCSWCCRGRSRPTAAFDDMIDHRAEARRRAQRARCSTRKRQPFNDASRAASWRDDVEAWARAGNRDMSRRTAARARAEHCGASSHEHNHRYYVLDEPSISDAEYDALFARAAGARSSSIPSC